MKWVVVPEARGVRAGRWGHIVKGLVLILSEMGKSLEHFEQRSDMI